MYGPGHSFPVQTPQPYMQMHSPPAAVASFQKSSFTGPGYSQQQITGLYNGPGGSNVQQQMFNMMPLRDVTNTSQGRLNIEGPVKKSKPNNALLAVEDEINN